MLARPRVAVDLDGTLASHQPGTYRPGVIGDPIPGAVEFTRCLSMFADVVVHTCRTNEEFGERPAKELGGQVRAWLDAHGFIYADVWIGVGKPIASAYVDDRAVVCTPMAVEPIPGPDGEPEFGLPPWRRARLLETIYRRAIADVFGLVPPGSAGFEAYKRAYESMKVTP